MNEAELNKRVVFLDRDGVINQDSPDYIKTPEEFNFLPGSAEGISKLSKKGYDVIIITNQSVINRKMVTGKVLDEIFSKMKNGVIAEGGEINDIFFCPHTPDDKCTCRKPAPGLILNAQKKYGIDLKSSVMVGDSAKDIEAARNAGCGLAVLVKTGNGIKAESALKEKNIIPDYIAEDLFDAVNWIIMQG